MKRQNEKSDKTTDYKDFKSKQPKPSFNRKVRRSLAKELSGKGPNDIRWRSSSLLSKLAATLPFGYPAGLPFAGTTINYNNGNPVGRGTIVAGIMAIRMLVTLGRANSYNSGVNLASRKIYSYVRHANSGSKNYDAVDMSLYFGSWGQGAAALGWLQRIYKLITSFSGTNRYTPRELVIVNGVDYDDIKQHQAELAWLIRWFGNALNSLYVPKMPYFEAAYYTFSKLFEDNTSPKNQYYLFTPESFGVYNPTYDSNGGGIDYGNSATAVPLWSGTLLKYADLYVLVHTLMDVLLSDEDIGIMSGDILKCYGESGVFKCVAESDTDIKAEHSEEILQQIHNATFVPAGMLTFSGYKQDPGATNTAPYLVSDVSVGSAVFTGSASYPIMRVSQYIDAFSGEPNPDEIINCSVLKASIRLKSTGTANQFNPDVTTLDHDMYLPRTVQIIGGTGTTTGTVIPAVTAQSDVISLPVLVGQAQASGGMYSTGVYAMTQFDWHPIIVVIDQSHFNTFGSSILGDIQNLNFFSDQVFERIHDTSMLSLFDFTE